jgi:hydroxyacylglutathione hydrolase
MINNIIPVPAFNDNYIWLITDTARQYGIIVDPGDAAPILEVLENTQIIPVAILVTHHHWDHSGGVAILRENYTLPVYAAECLQDGAEISIPKMGLNFTVLSIPGHTLDHLAYYGHGMLFCGDTLFSAGCGRVFEGTAAQMYQSLMRLADLPMETQVYCGHEYTLANLRFAEAVEPNNLAIRERIQTVSALCHQSLPTLPSTIGLEKQTNPFLRCSEPDVITMAEKKAGHKLTSPTKVFQTLRNWKDGFAG